MHASTGTVKGSNMSPEVVKRKLELLVQYLEDLRKHRNITYDEFLDKHYEIERILELLIETASNIVFHLVVQKDKVPPSTYRSAFLRAGELFIISEPLAQELAKAAGLRNVLAHEYDKIDYERIYKTIPIAIEIFQNLILELK